jgi:hypothetical protein
VYHWLQDGGEGGQELPLQLMADFPQCHNPPARSKGSPVTELKNRHILFVVVSTITSFYLHSPPTPIISNSFFHMPMALYLLVC